MTKPELLDGEEGLIDVETRNEIPSDRLRQAVKEYSNGIQIIAALENGRFTMTMQDYLRLPNAFIDAWAIYRRIVDKMRKIKDGIKA